MCSVLPGTWLLLVRFYLDLSDFIGGVRSGSHFLLANCVIYNAPLKSPMTRMYVNIPYMEYHGVFGILRRLSDWWWKPHGWSKEGNQKLHGGAKAR